jgi:hypothetical protein
MTLLNIKPLEIFIAKSKHLGLLKSSINTDYCKKTNQCFDRKVYSFGFYFFAVNIAVKKNYFTLAKIPKDKLAVPISFSYNSKQ